MSRKQGASADADRAAHERSRVAPSPPSVGIPSAATWWAGDNDEFYRVGPYRTRDEALGEAMAYFGYDRPIHLLRATLAEWSAPSGASVIDMMVDNSDELFFDDGFPGMDGTKDAVAEAEADLDQVLTAWVDKWRNIFPTPSAFGWTGEREIVPALAKERGEQP